MKNINVTINPTKGFRTAIKSLYKVVSKEKLTDLRQLKVQMANGKLTFSTFSSAGATVSVSPLTSADSTEDFSVILSDGVAAATLLKNLADRSLLFMTIYDREVDIEDKRFAISTGGEPAPIISSSGLDEVKAYPVDGKEFRTKLNWASKASGRLDVRYYLNGVAFVDSLIVATDGSRLHRAEIKSVTDIAPKSERMSIIPNDTIKLILLSLPTTFKETVKLQWMLDSEAAMYAEGREGVVVSATYPCGAEILIASPLIDGKFPQWERIVPKSHERSSISGGTKAFASMIKAMSAYYLPKASVENPSAVKLSSKGDVALMVSSKSAGSSYKEVYSACMSDFDINKTFSIRNEDTFASINMKYVKEALPPEGMVTMYLPEYPVDATLMTSGEYLAVMMPIRVKVS